jgi:GNAT superfamily N-acetyltransferase
MTVEPSVQQLVVRAAHASDLQALADMHDRCSAEALHRRYALSDPALAARLLDVLVLNDPVRVSLVATDPWGGVIGHAQLCILPSGAAEVTVLVEDRHQGHGVGSALLARLAAVAQQRGVRQLRGRTQPDNWSLYGALVRAGIDAEVSYDTEGVLLTAPVPGQSRPQRPRRSIRWSASMPAM